MIVSKRSRFQSEIDQNFKAGDKCFKGVFDSYHDHHKSFKVTNNLYLVWAKRYHFPLNFVSQSEYSPFSILNPEVYFEFGTSSSENVELKTTFMTHSLKAMEHSSQTDSLHQLLEVSCWHSSPFSKYSQSPP